MINKNKLTELFDIDINSGKFYWKNVSKYHKRLNGTEAGNSQISKNGKFYWVIKIHGKRYKRGRLMFLYIHGYFPEPCIDHISGNSLDDRPLNLRQASLLENSWNHKSRKKKSILPMGVRLSGDKYMARIAFNKKTIYLGVYETSEQAELIYKNKRVELYGKFAGY